VTVEDLQPPPFDPTKTTRQRTEQKTARASCMGCHAQLNPLGFALEEYDALARHRGGVERVLALNPPHNVSATLPLDLNVEPNLGGGVLGSVQGARGLAALMVDSGRGEACLARKYFTYTFRRSEDLRADACALQGLYKNLSHRSGGTLRDMFVDVAYLPEFRYFSKRGAP